MKSVIEKYKKIIKKYDDIFKLLLVSTIITAIFYFLFHIFVKGINIVDSISSILAIPAFLLSIAVLNAVDIKPKNLDAYHRRRVVKENERKENKKRHTKLLMIV